MEKQLERMVKGSGLGGKLIECIEIIPPQNCMVIAYSSRTQGEKRLSRKKTCCCSQRLYKLQEIAPKFAGHQRHLGNASTIGDSDPDQVESC